MAHSQTGDLMARTGDLTRLVCLFHHKDQAHAAIEDLVKSGVARFSISSVGSDDSEDTASERLQSLGVPDRDRKHILDSLRNGGMLVAVSATEDEVGAVEKVFGRHRAGLVDEADVERNSAAPVEEAVIPIAEEELVIGKRTVDQGGVRVYRRIVAIPVDKSVTLHEQHVNVERHPVDRPATDADLSSQGERTLEFVETAEERVVGKSARVVEEVVVGKSQTERTEHIHDTVRRTEVQVEDVGPDSGSRKPSR
jgi:uncharacterized protein (TIGR02271 family)